MPINRLLKKLSRRILYGIFKFDFWHTSILEDRPYAVDIVEFCNKRSSRNSILEIGCGLGDIIRKANYGQKWGFDKDYNVIRAARFLSNFNKFKNIEFEVFNFPDTELKITVDVIIMVNWPFLFDSSFLEQHLRKYFMKNLTPGGHIIIDTLQDIFYPNNHDINQLTKNLNAKIVKIGK